jgi:hypothetical protein
MNLEKIIKLLEAKNTELNLALDSYAESNKKIRREKEKQLKLETVKNIVIEIGKKSQSEILNYIESVVTMALQTVFGEEYSFKIEFEIKREQPEIRFLIGKGDLYTEPRMDINGHGFTDVAGFALQLLVWSLEKPQSISVLLFDEYNFKNVSKGNLTAVADMVRKLCDEMEIQLIQVSHISEMIESSDNIIEIN